MSKLNFNKISLENFLSVGATPVEFDLDTNKSTVITGHNGAGKSTIIDALCYVLFNKPLSDKKLPQLISSVNRKKMKVQVDFEVNGRSYTIVRGQKPTIFTVQENGTPWNESASSAELQRLLEANVLGCNFKTFTQVVIMSTTNYKYFMELSAGDRRITVDAMLDIEVVSEMAKVNKERVKQSKHDQERINNEIELNQTKIDTKQQHIDNLATVSDNQLSMVDENIKKAKEEIKGIEISIANLEADCPKKPEDVVYPDKPAYPTKKVLEAPVMPAKPEQIQPDYSGLVAPEKIHLSETKAPTEIEAERDSISVEMRTLINSANAKKESASFYLDNTTCDVCKQVISEDHKHQIVGDINTEVAKLGANYKELKHKHDTIIEQIRKVYEQIDAEKVLADQHRQKLEEYNREREKINSHVQHQNYEINHKWELECMAIKSDHSVKVSQIDADHSSLCNQIDRDYAGICKNLDDEYNTKFEPYNLAVRDIASLNYQLNDKTTHLNSLEAQKSDLMKIKSQNNQEHYDELERLTTKHSDLLSERSVINEMDEIYSLCTQMLKDNGLKAKIVQQYLPTINKSINDYLDILGANYSFTLDDQFSETILSRYRDNYSYGSFSNGERSRINLAIMMMWRDLAKSKNTVSSNLIIFDEVLDGSLDPEGINSVLSLFERLEDTNLMVITHRKEVIDYFDNHISVEKIGNYSQYSTGK